MKQSTKTLAIWVGLIVMFVAFYQFFNGAQGPVKVLSYGDFVDAVVAEKIKDVTFEGQEYRGHLTGGAAFRATGSKTPPDELVRRLSNQGVDIRFEKEPEGFWSTALVSYLPMLFIALVFFFFLRQLRGGATVVGQSPARLTPAKKNQLRLIDVGGLGPARAELLRIVRDVVDEKKMAKLGGQAPKSLLLTGPSGVGKTAVARALAGELGRPLHTMAGSEFFEAFIGVGARRVREFFGPGNEQKRVLFLDELDAVGRLRSQKGERDETLNQLLIQMDALDKGVFLIAATNRPDLLDPALLRPGRFDRRLELALPDEAGRLEILKLKTAEMPLEPEVVLPALAAATPGFSGAALEQLAREAALVAAQRGGDKVSQADFEQARGRVTKTLAPEPAPAAVH